MLHADGLVKLTRYPAAGLSMQNLLLNELRMGRCWHERSRGLPIGGSLCSALQPLDMKLAECCEKDP